MRAIRVIIAKSGLNFAKNAKIDVAIPEDIPRKVANGGKKVGKNEGK